MTLRIQPEIDGVAVVQEWEGYVLEVVGDEFVARLVDITAGSSHEEEEAIIPLAEISDGDAAALRVGGIFRWGHRLQVFSSRHQGVGESDRVSRSSPYHRPRLSARPAMGTRDDTSVQAVTDDGRRPKGSGGIAPQSRQKTLCIGLRNSKNRKGWTKRIHPGVTTPWTSCSFAMRPERSTKLCGESNKASTSWIPTSSVTSSGRRTSRAS